MMLKTFRILLDIEKELYSPSNLLFRVSRNDLESVELQFEITQDEAALNLTGTTIELAIKKPSGLTVYQDCTITNAIEGKASCILVTQSYIEQGIHTAEVYVRTATQLAVTSSFYYFSRETVLGDETEESVNEWSDLQQALFAYDLKPILTTGFPTAVPEYIGQMAFDTVNRLVYIANDLTAVSWQAMVGGEGGGGSDAVLGTTAPTAIPARIGQLYINTTAKTAYIATGATAADWEQIDAAGMTSVSWGDVTGKPTTFPPDIHTHAFADITGKPATYPPDSHMHNIAAVDGLQAALDGKADDAHTHAYADITGKPATFAPSAHTHSYADITGKPATFAPSTHSHAIADITNLQTTLDGKADDADLAGKANTVHSHAIADITNLQTTLDAKADEIDVYTKAEVYNKTETYNKPEVDAMIEGVTEGGGTIIQDNLTSTQTGHALSANQGRILKDLVDGKAAVDHNHDSAYAAINHSHTIANVTGLQTALDGKADDADLAGKSDVGHTHAYADITGKPTTFAPSAHTHSTADVTGLDTALDGKADDVHTHAIADVTGLQGTLDGKSDTGHTHAYVDITGKPATFAPSAHTHLWADITDKPATFPATAHTHLWADITDKPATFAPSAHTHAIADVTNLQTTLDGKQPKPISVTAIPATTPTHAGQMAIDSTNKNTYIAEGTAVGDWKRLIDAADLATKANTTHTHAIADVTNLQTTLDGKADDADLAGKSDVGHTHAYADITAKPATFPPNLMSGTVIGGAMVGNGLAMSGNYLFAKTVAADGTKINTTNNSIAIDRATTDTWYASSAQMAGLTLWQGTQAAYDAITTKSGTTLYFITG